jgi:hypothetical protein
MTATIIRSCQQCQERAQHKGIKKTATLLCVDGDSAKRCDKGDTQRSNGDCAVGLRSCRGRRGSGGGGGGGGRGPAFRGSLLSDRHGSDTGSGGRSSGSRSSGGRGSGGRSSGDRSSSRRDGRRRRRHHDRRHGTDNACGRDGYRGGAGGNSSSRRDGRRRRRHYDRRHGTDNACGRDCYRGGAGGNSSKGRGSCACTMVNPRRVSDQACARQQLHSNGMEWSLGLGVAATQCCWKASSGSVAQTTTAVVRNAQARVFALRR